ncbi:transposase [Azorhizobium doebereinerae]|uniref:transposase n=1 Tax=Azorhizobium doebereinerae TaxID=281091 RepID=UPI000A01DF85
MNGGGFWLTEYEFECVRPLLPCAVRGRPRADDRMVISGIIHVLKSEVKWSDAPACYGSPRTLYNRYVRWSELGVWDDVVRLLVGMEGVLDRLMLVGCRGSQSPAFSGVDGGKVLLPPLSGRGEGPAFCALRRCPFVRSSGGRRASRVRSAVFGR